MAAALAQGAFLDVMMSFERSPVRPSAWANVRATRPKETGFRTVGLTCDIMRNWSALRQPISAAWTATRSDSFLWGTTGRAADGY